MIKEITWKQIYSVWANHLWPTRSSPIDTHSAMCFLKGHDMANKKTNVTFYGYFINDQIAGVNSGHGCSPIENYPKNYRSRGLFVFEKFRGQGIGLKLLEITAEKAKLEGYEMIWSYPRNTSFPTYSKAGYVLASNWMETETGTNAFALSVL